MSEKQQEIDVYETRRFEKAMDKLTKQELLIVEDEIDIIVDNPNTGKQKKGDLSHLWVHKFPLNNQQALLGYTWVEDKLELYLLNIGSHENFYKEAKRKRDSDLKLMKP